MSSNLTPSAKLTLRDAAWLAGYIDGDGSISIGKTTKRWRAPIVVIDSADLEILEYVTKIVGRGAIVKKTMYQAHHRQTYSWRLVGANNILHLLKQIYPHLRCAFKKERARMMLKEWKAVTPRNGTYWTIDQTEEEGFRKKTEFETRFMAIGFGRGSRSKENLLTKTGL